AATAAGAATTAASTAGRSERITEPAQLRARGDRARHPRFLEARTQRPRAEREAVAGAAIELGAVAALRPVLLHHRDERVHPRDRRRGRPALPVFARTTCRPC